MGKAGWLAQGTAPKEEAGGPEERQVMIYKRGKFYWYKFVWHGRLIRESTKQGNDKVARQMESAHRTSLAKGEVGIREKKLSPTLTEFIDQHFEPWAKATFEKASPRHGPIGIEWASERSKAHPQFVLRIPSALIAIRPTRDSHQPASAQFVQLIRLPYFAHQFPAFRGL